MAGQIEAMYETIAKHTRSLASKNSTAVKFATGAVGVNMAAGVINKSLKGPKNLAESMYPNMRMNMGSGKHGLAAGGSSDLGMSGLKFGFRKKK